MQLFYTYYADTLITIMLGWIRAFTDWIWNLISLGDGSAGRSFLNWFSESWVMLVVVLVAAGVVIDWLVWMVRWRPYWLWFGRKRRILDDTNEPVRPRERRGASAQQSVRRSEAPHFTSAALPRTAPIGHPEETKDYEDDDLFDVVSLSIGQSPAPAPQQALVGNSVSQYINNTQKQRPAAQNRCTAPKQEEINWFE